MVVEVGPEIEQLVFEVASRRRLDPGLVHQNTECVCGDFAFRENEHFVHFVLGRLLVDSRRVGRLPLVKAQKRFLQLAGVEAAPGGQAAQKPRDRCQRDARSTKKVSGEIEISPSPLFA
jgi:hypothetical protein